MTDSNEQIAARDALLRQAGEIFEKLPMAGPVVWLYTQAPAYRHLFLGDLEWRLLPALSLGQCKLYMKDKAPLAFVSWARVNSEVDERLAAGQVRLAPSDWKSGDTFWIIDLIAPFGGAESVLKDLRENVLSGKEVKYLVPDSSGKGFGIKTL